MEYAYIVNPESGRRVKIGGRTGIRVLKNYLTQAHGGHSKLDKAQCTEIWQKDSGAKKCSVKDCGNTAFVPFVNRKHHCRRCGLVVCGPCSKGRVALGALIDEGTCSLDPRGKDKNVVRICDDCLIERENKLLSTDGELKFIDEQLYPPSEMGMSQRTRRNSLRKAIIRKRATKNAAQEKKPKKGWFGR